MKIVKLIYNEILKQTKKLSFKIAFLILVLFAIGVPFLYKMVIYNDDVFPLYYESDIEYYENDLVEDAETSQDKLHNELVNVRIDVVKKAISNDESASNFRMDVYEEYIRTKRLEIVLNYMIQDKDIDYEEIDNDFELNSSYLEGLSKEELQDQIDNLNKELDVLNETITNNDYSWYLNSQIENLKANDNLNDIDKKTLEVYEKLQEVNVTDEDDFRVDEANSIIENYSLKTEVLSKDEYDKLDSTILYDDYVKLTNLKNEALDEKIAMSFKAIEDNVNYNNNDAKTSLSDSINTNNVILSIIVVVIAGGIVANEFQKGTIRLLVIRPNKRWKILLSKFLAVVFIAVGLALITYALSFIANGIMFGFDNLFNPSLEVVNNKVVQTSYILNSLGNMFILLIPVIFIGLIAFCLSTVINNTAFSVGLSIFILMGYSMALMVLQMLGFPFIDLTFLPYLSYAQFLDPLALAQSCEFNSLYYTFFQANIVLLVWGVILYGISNIVFVRKDIKN